MGRPGAAPRRARRRGTTRTARRRCASATSSSWAWARRWPTTRPSIGAIRRLTDPAPDGLGHVGPRHHDVDGRARARRSTSSTAEGIPVTLALSLHAPDDELRNELVPINTRWSVDEALDAAHRYYEATGRRVSHRVRPDPRHQRPGLARRPAGREAQPARPWLGPRQPDPAQPDARLEVDGVTARRRAAVRRARCGPTASRRRSATPAARTSTAPAASSPRPPPERVADGAGSAAQQRERLVRRVDEVHGARPSPAPTASAVSAAHTGTVRVQCSPPTSTGSRQRVAGARVVERRDRLEDLLHGAGGALEHDDARRSHRASRPSSRSALEKYLAMPSQNTLGGSWP